MRLKGRLSLMRNFFPEKVRKEASCSSSNYGSPYIADSRRVDGGYRQTRSDYDDVIFNQSALYTLSQIPRLGHLTCPTRSGCGPYLSHDRTPHPCPRS